MSVDLNLIPNDINLDRADFFKIQDVSDFESTDFNLKSYDINFIPIDTDLDRVDFLKIPVDLSFIPVDFENWILN